MSEKKPIGFDTNQIPMNSMLGSMAFQSFDNVKISGGKIPDSVLPASTFLKNSAQILTNKLTTSSSALNTSPLTIPQGDVPSILSNGDIFITSGGIYAEINDSLVKLNNQSTYNDGFEVLVVGGGGGGGHAGGNSSGSGGGGGGGTQIIKLSPFYGQQFSVQIGAGGSGGTSSALPTNGNNTSFGNYASLGGGAGASPYFDTAGNDGGSGGGGGVNANGFGGIGTSGQGSSGRYQNTGGAGSGSSPIGYIGGGGTTFFGKTYGGGGGGGGTGLGGVGGGGTSSDGIQNTGGGGAGRYTTYIPPSTTTSTPAAGGSGIAIVAYPGAQRATGGTITTSGGFTFHTFNGSGTFTWLGGYDAPDLVGQAVVGVTKINE